LAEEDVLSEVSWSGATILGKFGAQVWFPVEKKAR
jgi:hypothetical protein